jgi:hypothetical protein
VLQRGAVPARRRWPFSCGATTPTTTITAIKTMLLPPRIVPSAASRPAAVGGLG